MRIITLFLIGCAISNYVNIRLGIAIEEKPIEIIENFEELQIRVFYPTPCAYLATTTCFETRFGTKRKNERVNQQRKTLVADCQRTWLYAAYGLRPNDLQSRRWLSTFELQKEEKLFESINEFNQEIGLTTRNRRSESVEQNQLVEASSTTRSRREDDPIISTISTISDLIVSSPLGRIVKPMATKLFTNMFKFFYELGSTFTDQNNVINAKITSQKFISDSKTRFCTLVTTDDDRHLQNSNLGSSVALQGFIKFENMVTQIENSQTISNTESELAIIRTCSLARDPNQCIKLVSKGLFKSKDGHLEFDEVGNFIYSVKILLPATTRKASLINVSNVGFSVNKNYAKLELENQYVKLDDQIFEFYDPEWLGNAKNYLFTRVLTENSCLTNMYRNDATSCNFVSLKEPTFPKTILNTVGLSYIPANLKCELCIGTNCHKIHGVTVLGSAKRSRIECENGFRQQIKKTKWDIVKEFKNLESNYPIGLEIDGTEDVFEYINYAITCFLTLLCVVIYKILTCLFTAVRSKLRTDHSSKSDKNNETPSHNGSTIALSNSRLEHISET